MKRMTLDEFLVWDDGTDTRYELIAGFPVAMMPGMEDRGVLSIRVGEELERKSTQRFLPAGRAELWAKRAFSTRTGPTRSSSSISAFVVDIGVTCAPRERRRRYMQAPILLVDSDSRHAEIHRRQGEQRIIRIIDKPDGTIPLASVGVEIAMSELYELYGGFTFAGDPED